MKSVFVVLEHVPYEGDTVMRIYDNKEDAEAYASILEKENVFGHLEYKVEEEKLYSKEPAWSLANDDHN